MNGQPEVRKLQRAQTASEEASTRGALLGISMDGWLFVCYYDWHKPRPGRGTWSIQINWQTAWAARVLGIQRNEWLVWAADDTQCPVPLKRISRYLSRLSPMMLMNGHCVLLLKKCAHIFKTARLKLPGSLGDSGSWSSKSTTA